MIAALPPNHERAEWAAARARLDVFLPQSFFVETERAADGRIVSVATVFLTNRECPWRCIYCELWKNTTTETVPRGAIPAQIAFAISQLTKDEPHFAHGARQIKLYNSGSFFDPKAIPPGDFSAIAQCIHSFERVIVESHPALIGNSTLRFRDLLPTGCSLEVAMGLEVADDALLEKINKRMTLVMFRRAADFLVSNGIDVRAFIIVKPPFVRTDAEAGKLACRSIDFAFECGAGVVSLIPARFGPDALAELERTGDFSPPSFETVETALDHGIAQNRGRVFTDLWDIEKLGGCPHCWPDRISRLREMNLSQSVLPRIPCAHESLVPC